MALVELEEVIDQCPEGMDKDNSKTLLRGIGEYIELWDGLVYREQATREQANIEIDLRIRETLSTTRALCEDARNAVPAEDTPIPPIVPIPDEMIEELYEGCLDDEGDRNYCLCMTDWFQTNISLAEFLTRVETGTTAQGESWMVEVNERCR